MFDRRRPSREPVWGDRDRALLHACRIGAALRTGTGLESIARITTTFPPSLGPGEPLWAHGAYTAYEYRAVGDGSYSVPGSFVVGSGALGVGPVVGSLANRAVARSRARSQAAADLEPRWVPAHKGDIYVGDAGCCFQAPEILPWSWDAISEAVVVEPGLMRWSGNGAKGPVVWMVRTGWAELVFLLWALKRHPSHPQLADGSWLPEGWVQRARAQDSTVSAAVAQIGVAR